MIWIAFVAAWFGFWLGWAVACALAHREVETYRRGYEWALGWAQELSEQPHFRTSDQVAIDQLIDETRP